MQSPNNTRKERIALFIRSPFGIMFIIFLVITVVIVTIFLYQQASPSKFVYESSTDIDPASGETIYTDNTENEAQGAAYVGFYDLLNAGLTTDQYELLQTIMETYAGDRTDTPLKRVSLKKDSLYLPRANVFEFTIVLNIDQETLIVIFDASKSPATIENISITFKKNNQQVWAY